MIITPKVELTILLWSVNQTSMKKDWIELYEIKTRGRPTINDEFCFLFRVLPNDKVGTKM